MFVEVILGTKADTITNAVFVDFAADIAVIFAFDIVIPVRAEPSK